jgi:rRNA processing protein Gar1
VLPAEQRGYWEVLNAAYGMGRQTADYRGHLMTLHGGDLPGFHSQVSFLPKEHIGVLVLVIGNHTAPLYNLISYNVYERLLGMDQTPWSQRMLDIRLKAKEAGKQARTKGGVACRTRSRRTRSRITWIHMKIRLMAC